MKKMFYLFVMLLSCTLQAQEVEFNDDKVLELKEVVQASGMKQDAIFIAVQSMLSDWTYNENSQMKIDYQDKASGVVISKGRLYMGYKKLGMLFGWDVYADYSLTIKAKDDRYQIIIKIPSLYFYHTQNVADRPTDTAPISQLYPTYSYKGQYRIKGAANEFAPKVPELIKSLSAAVQAKIKSTSVDDDF